MFDDPIECSKAYDRAILRAFDAEQEFGKDSDQVRWALDECVMILAEWDRMMRPLMEAEDYPPCECGYDGDDCGCMVAV